MLYALVVAILACTHALAFPAPDNYVVHEVLGARHPRWEARTVLRRDSSSQFKMRIALTQQNLHHGEKFLMEVSDPNSNLFSQHWSTDKITRTFSPSQASKGVVRAWLIDFGIKPEAIITSRDGGWLNFFIGVEDAEKLLRAKYHIFTDNETGESQLACESYSLPQSIREHIDIIMPTVHLSTKPRKRSLLKSHDLSIQPVKTSNVGVADQRIKDLSKCDTLSTPDCIRALYHIPNGVTANPKNTYGILELSPETYSQPGLDVFFKNFTPALVGKPPKLESVDGGAILPPGPPPITSSVCFISLDVTNGSRTTE